MAPLYDFRCPAGHVTEALCKSDLSDAPKTCEAPVSVPGGPTDCNGTNLCGRKLERAMAAPALFPGADRWRGGL